MISLSNHYRGVVGFILGGTYHTPRLGYPLPLHKIKPKMTYEAEHLLACILRSTLGTTCRGKWIEAG